MCKRIFVFKTTVKNKSQLNTVGKMLAKLEKVVEWHIDQEDPDNVLRLVSRKMDPDVIVCHFQSIGFECEELPVDELT